MSQHVKTPLPERTLNFARALRENQTDAEHKLWQHLRARQLNGLKFRRQHPMPPYIVDFYCEAHKLVVELDGSQHNPQVDARRTRYLEAQGVTILRYWDNDALQHTDAVLQAILNFIEERALTPTPLPTGEGLKE